MTINGIGTIPSYEKIINVFSKVCTVCHNNVVFELVEVAKKFTFWWIPIAKYKKKYYVICPICEHGNEISEVEAKQLVEKYKRPKDYL